MTGDINKQLKSQSQLQVNFTKKISMPMNKHLREQNHVKCVMSKD